MVLKFGRLVGMHRRLELLAEFIDPRRVVVLHRPQLARHVNPRRHMLRLLEGPQHLIDHRRDLLVGIDLPNTGPFVLHHRAKYFRFLTKKMVDSIIYPNAMLEMFKDDKVKGSVMLTSRDDWFNKSNHTNQHRWSQNLDNLVKNNKNYYKFKNDKLIAPQHILSKPYFIAKAQQEK